MNICHNPKGAATAFAAFLTQGKQICQPPSRDLRKAVIRKARRIRPPAARTGAP